MDYQKIASIRQRIEARSKDWRRPLTDEERREYGMIGETLTDDELREVLYPGLCERERDLEKRGKDRANLIRAIPDIVRALADALCANGNGRVEDCVTGGLCTCSAGRAIAKAKGEPVPC